MSEELVKQPIIWVDKNEQLDELCQLWESKPMLAVDTEFMRSNTYYPIAGLIQINDGESNYLIDPKTVNDYFPLVEILDNPNIIKVFHSGSEDLEVFQHTVGCTPKNIFDTQIAGAFSGYGFSVGFANMVKAALGVELPKTETRSDWLARPLSQSQIYYAALDVEYLFALANKLISNLTSTDRLSWAREESEALVERYFVNQDPDNSFLRVKSLWKLNARQLATVKALARWREDYAQERDLPRNRILKEHTLFDIAKLAPKHIAQLRGLDGLTERMIKHHGQKMIDLVDQWQNAEESILPNTLPLPLGPESKTLLKDLKSLVGKISEQTDLPIEILVKKKDYEFLVRGYLDDKYNLSLPDNLEGWRRDLVGKPLLEMLSRLD